MLPSDPLGCKKCVILNQPVGANAVKPVPVQYYSPENPPDPWVCLDVAPHGDGVPLPDVARVNLTQSRILDLHVDDGHVVHVQLDASVLGAEHLVLGRAGQHLALTERSTSQILDNIHVTSASVLWKQRVGRRGYTQARYSTSNCSKAHIEIQKFGRRHLYRNLLNSALQVW